MFKMDDNSAMGIAEGIRFPLTAIEVYPINIPVNLTDSAALDRG